MLLGAEKRRKEEEGLESKASSRSEPSKLESGRPSAANSCKDVECFSLMEIGFRSRDQAMGVGRTRAQEEDSIESDSGSAGFEFQKAERTPHHRATAALVPLFSKPAPSKWDDAHKWIASPTSNRGGNKGGGGGGQAKKGDLVGYVNRHTAAKAALDVVEEVDTKRVDVSQAKKEMGAAKSMSWVGEHHPAPDSGAKPAAVLENPVVDSDVNFSWHDSSSTQSDTTFMTPVPTIRAVSMRDMGTEMTPIASQEPSRTGTPIRATSPLSSPPLSLPSTPQRSAPGSTQTDTIPHQELSIKELSEKEQHRKTRREIMVLGQQLGKTNIAAWASKEDEELYASTSTNMVSKDHSARSVIEARAAAWEEAEKTKYLARFKQEEIKIMAWENHQKATIEAELRKIEVKVERMRASSHERLMSQLASVRHKAEDKRAAAGAKRNQQAAKTAQQADYIRRTGRIPSKFYCWGWCF
ncbi:uncharacterized protein LOC122025370 isoform X1 [Zingiber officinale]|uniref:Remorin C-terminal domain-containing protein n=1 Tax=Zingiber officinale TaxID=94328 RepID=A0A8J5CFN7_ZINOF|nr:uncharacterized protein LOC122025370 isoform X1 [Zingiber officinale]KAG6474903.1 hypothetical protein ZIOFF_064119 [Zingiber officinale]